MLGRPTNYGLALQPSSQDKEKKPYWEFAQIITHMNLRWALYDLIRTVKEPKPFRPLWEYEGYFEEMALKEARSLEKTFEEMANPPYPQEQAASATKAEKNPKTYQFQFIDQDGIPIQGIHVIAEDIASNTIIKNSKHFDKFAKVFTFLVQAARFTEVSKEVIAKSISRSLANSVNLSNTNRLMKDHFLARDVYMDGKTPLAPSQSQLTRVVALKSALMILTIQSLHEKWLEVDKIVNSNQPVQSYYDWVKSVCCIFQAAGETATAGAVAYMIGAIGNDYWE